jgi:hypothetical protein
MVYPVDGGSSTIMCGTCGYRDNELAPPLTWSPDGKLAFLSFLGGASVFAVPLRPGQALPPLPAKGIRSFEDVAALPGAKPIQGAFPATDPSVYGYPKAVAQRNIYRVPIP